MQPDPEPEATADAGPDTVPHALFEALVREHGPRLRVFLGAAVRDPLIQDELFQEALLVAWRRIGDFDPERSFGHWLRGIARNLILARRRADGRRGPLVAPDVLEELGALCEVDGPEGERLGEELDALRVCLDHLPDDARSAVRLHYTDGHRGPELAERLGRSVEATKKLMQRVRARLFDCMTMRLEAREGI
ncbi:ECF RNA polymerase sigma-E factor [Planctomycetes bacterium Pla163]|uniref:ECF RNA polymerase sigma-E factor n=1 Tax=Rohdeia mirabilis TaxID=2528008 RepID=A0A518CZP1_9BACT|nr:ECF RNA polymerase sigma-E factor [Planctomycetes bacterium Pla163]